MTIVDYYEVVRETDKTIVLRMLESETETTGFLSGKDLPGSEYFKDGDGEYKEVRAYKRTHADGSTFYISRKGGVYTHYQDWDGKAHSFNHCD